MGLSLLFWSLNIYQNPMGVYVTSQNSLVEAGVMIAALIAAKIGVLIAQATTGPVLGNTPPETWAQWGLAGMVVIYTFWRDHQREIRMSQLIDTQRSQHLEERVQEQRWVRETMTANMQAVLNCMRAVESGLDNTNKSLNDLHNLVKNKTV